MVMLMNNRTVFTLLNLFVAVALSSSTIKSVQYCIIGAGPGGIQLGHFLDRAKRDYIIFEQKSTAGNFFRTFPKHRKLISINKRFRGNAAGIEYSESFAMRHDWNSLLGNATPPLTERTRDLYPSADDLYKYLEDFAKGQNILYNTKVLDIRKMSNQQNKDLKQQHFLVSIASENFVEIEDEENENENENENEKSSCLNVDVGNVMNGESTCYEYDPIGMVCGWDNTDLEAYCEYDSDGIKVCARATNGGRCKEGAIPTVKNKNQKHPNNPGRTRSTSNTKYECENLILANGVAVPNKPIFYGHEHVVDYVDLPMNGNWSDGKRVLVLGLGNAALEAANSLNGWATETTVMGRKQKLPSEWRKNSGEYGLRFSYNTHYVGDMRQVNLNILDMYQLKSLDGFEYFEDTSEGGFKLNGSPYGFFKGSSIIMKFGSFPCHHRDSYKEMSEVLNLKGVYICDKARRYVEIAENVIDIGAIEQLAKSIALITKNKRKQWEKIGTDLRYMAMGETFFGDQNESPTIDLEDRLIKRKEKVSFYAAGGMVTGYVVKVSFEAMQNVKVIDLVIEFKTTFGSNEANRYGYHAIIRCFGWNSDRTLSQNIQPEWHTKGKLKKYPKTTSVFQSTNINNLYYAGALTHGRDFRKAAGGFIHGFRYNAQVLFHALEWKHHNVPWPSVRIPLRKTTDRKRILMKLIRIRTSIS